MYMRGSPSSWSQSDLSKDGRGQPLLFRLTELLQGLGDFGGDF
jgi:hypothetical protein